MTDAPQIEIETVAEILAVDRETITVLRFDDGPGEVTVGLGYSGRFGGEYVQITFPADKAGAIAAAILKMAEPQ